MADESGDSTGARSGTLDSSSTAAATTATVPIVRVAGVTGVIAPFNGRGVNRLCGATGTSFHCNDIIVVAKRER